jgi:hypothetical protein
MKEEGDHDSFDRLRIVTKIATLQSASSLEAVTNFPSTSSSSQ